MTQTQYVVGIACGERMSTEKVMAEYIAQGKATSDQVCDSIDTVVRVVQESVAEYIDRRIDEVDSHAMGISEHQREQFRREYRAVSVYEMVIRRIGSVDAEGSFTKSV